MPLITKRYYLVVALLGLLSSCTPTKSIVVNLSPTTWLSRKMGERAYSTNRIAADSEAIAYAKQQELNTYIFTQFRHRPWEQLYKEWKGGKTDSVSFADVLLRYTREGAHGRSYPLLDKPLHFPFGWHQQNRTRINPI
ncbi:MAG TPA: hypothetical protein VD794_12640 [Flavisolibacter sp.]|nr:hypothetical protein [Flavisolibacter sp.]